jgi:hypothetical protein
MTIGSGNGWPDVIKVPAQKVDHDPLCRQQHWDGGDCFDCRLIAKVRADERDAVKAEYVPVLMEHLRILADLRAKIETLPIWEDSQGWKVMSYLDVVALLDGGG